METRVDENAAVALKLRLVHAEAVLVTLKEFNTLAVGG